MKRSIFSAICLCLVLCLLAGCGGSAKADEQINEMLAAAAADTGFDIAQITNQNVFPVQDGKRSLTFTYAGIEFTYVFDAETNEITDKQPDGKIAVLLNAVLADMNVSAADIKNTQYNAGTGVLSFKYKYDRYVYILNKNTGAIIDKQVSSMGDVDEYTLDDLFKFIEADIHISAEDMQDTNASRQGENQVIAFTYGGAKFVYTLNAKTGEIIDKMQEGEIKLYGSPLSTTDMIDVACRYYTGNQTDISDINVDLTKNSETPTVSYKTPEGNWEFIIDSRTGEILDLTEPAD